MRFFSSARDAARTRRPTDLVLLVLSALGLLTASLFREGSELTRALTRFVESLPGLFGWFWELAYDLLAVWALVLVLGAIVARRFGLVRDQLLAVVVAGSLVALLAEDGGSVLSALVSSDPPASFPSVRIGLATAVLVAASPHLVLPVRRVGRWILPLGATASVALGVGQPFGIVAGLALGAVGAMLIHLVFGSPGGRPTLEQVSQALDELGVPATGLSPAQLESRGVALVRATTRDGRPLLVKVYGRDARDGHLVATMWANLWYRDDTSRLALSRRQQVEHEGFVTLLAERAGVPVAPVITGGVTSGGDALVVLEAGGRPFSELGPDAISDGALRSGWDALDRLHASGLVHGRLDSSRLLLANGAVRITDLAGADTNQAPFLQLADEAQLLVTSALVAGPDRALRAAVNAIGLERLRAVLPFIQPPVLEAQTRRRLKASGIGIDVIRSSAARAAGVEVPKLESIRRVSWSSLLAAALLLAGAYVLMSGIVGLGIVEVLDELERASSGWIVVGLAAGPVVQVGQAFSTLGASPKRLQFGPVILLQFAVQFLALAVPSSASRIALNVRFFRGVGLTATEALAVGAVDSFAGFAVEAVIVLAVLASGAAALDLEIESSTINVSPRIAALIGLGLMLLVLVAIAVPKIRTLVRAKVIEATSVLRGLRSPGKLALLIGGNVGARLTLAVILSVSLRAFGYQLPLAELLLVNTIVSLFAGIMPIPGGIGVAEAATTAGLIAFGIPDATALATAIVFRLVTFYLPPIWGVAATRRLRQHGFI